MTCRRRGTTGPLRCQLASRRPTLRRQFPEGVKRARETETGRVPAMHVHLLALNWKATCWKGRCSQLRHCLLSPLHVVGRVEGEGERMLFKDEVCLWLFSQNRRKGALFVSLCDRRCRDSGRRVCTWTPAVLRGARLSLAAGATSSVSSFPSPGPAAQPTWRSVLPWIREGQAWNPGSGLSKVLVKAQMGSRWDPTGHESPRPRPTAAATGHQGAPQAPGQGSLGRVQLEGCLGTRHL